MKGSIKTLALFANLGVATWTIYEYMNLQWAGGGMCLAVLVTLAPLYRPLSLSLFSILVSVLDLTE